jgi:hypothetical protein
MVLMLELVLVLVFLLVFLLVLVVVNNHIITTLIVPVKTIG